MNPATFKDIAEVDSKKKKEQSKSVKDEKIDICESDYNHFQGRISSFRFFFFSFASIFLFFLFIVFLFFFHFLSFSSLSFSFSLHFFFFFLISSSSFFFFLPQEVLKERGKGGGVFAERKKNGKTGRKSVRSHVTFQLRQQNQKHQPQRKMVAVGNSPQRVFACKESFACCPCKMERIIWRVSEPKRSRFDWRGHLHSQLSFLRDPCKLQEGVKSGQFQWI